MTVGSADVGKAVATLWESSGLNTLFQSHWDSADRSLHLSLNDGEASAGCPFPYCVFRGRKPNIRARMSGEAGSEKQRIDDHPWEFEVHARQTSAKSAKEMASELAEEVLKVFGGHSSSAPRSLVLTTGSILLCQYQADWGEREDDQVHKWTVEYNIRVDVPEKIAA